jgi:hypothetical protein
VQSAGGTHFNDIDGRVERQPGNLGRPVHPAETTRVVEFNDIAAVPGSSATTN